MLIVIDKLTYHFGALWLWLPEFVLDRICPKRWLVYEQCHGDPTKRVHGRYRFRSDAREIARVNAAYFFRSVDASWVEKR